MNRDPSSKSGNKKSRSGVRAIAAATTLALAACNPLSGDKDAKPTAATTTTLAPETTTTTISPEVLAFQNEVEAKKYAESPERNQPFNDAVAKYGPRAVEAIRTGKLGPWDAYNFQTGRYRSRVKEAGWVNLVHTPDYGGSEHQLEVTVYQNSNGTYDLSKGIHGLSVHVEGMRYLSLQSPEESILTEVADTPGTGWKVSIDKLDSQDEQHPFNHSSPDNIYHLTADQLRAVDQDVLTALDQSMAALGLDQ